jgi:2-haloacid dehalogenase
MTIVAFDVYGTLVDTAGIGAALRPVVGDIAPEFARRWREKQLEYTFRRALMRRYVEFPVCVDQAFDHTLRTLNVVVDDDDRARILEAFRTLPAYPDAQPALEVLRARGVRCIAFSNGIARDVEALLVHGGLRAQIEGIVSLADIRTYKPDVAAYEYLCDATHTDANDIWLVSGNPFDVIGALGAGLRAAWVRRGYCEYDTWEFTPTAIVETLTGLPELFAR